MTSQQESYKEFAKEHEDQADLYAKEASHDGMLSFVGGFVSSLATIGLLKEIATDTENYNKYVSFGAIALLGASYSGYKLKDYLDSRKEAKKESQRVEKLQKLANEQ